MAVPEICWECGVAVAVNRGMCVACWDRDQSTCRGCGAVRDDVEVRHSFGIYAGRLCRACCSRYADNCGVGRLRQGRVEDLDEFMSGGYAAIDGDD
jgi:hypothetical protein